jgi:hypothetical protein
MAKKNFKDVTGIKFADLIMPLVMGGIGSYSPAAGRGVGLGLQAFRTFQAGQAFGDEREEKKAYKEWAAQQTANAEAQLEQLRQGKIDPSEVEHKGFEGKRGPATPVGGDEVEETPLGPGQISLFGDAGAEAALTDERDLDRGGEISGAMGSPQDMLTEALLGRKRSQDAAARDIEIAEGDLRFSQALQFMEPSTGGYMTTSDVMARRKNIDNLNYLNEQAGKWAETAAQKDKYTRNQIMLRSNRQEHVMRVGKELEGRFTSHNTSQGVILHDKDATDPDKALIFPDQDRQGGWQELMALPVEDKIDLYNRSLGKYMAAVELGQEAGEEFDMSTVKASRDMLKMLWVSMQDPDDMAVINQVNADRSAQGLPPITSLRELDSMFGLGDMGTSGKGNPRDKFIIE